MKSEECKFCNSTEDLVPLEFKIELFTPQNPDSFICRKCLSDKVEKRG